MCVWKEPSPLTERKQQRSGPLTLKRKNFLRKSSSPDEWTVYETEQMRLCRGREGGGGGGVCGCVGVCVGVGMCLCGCAVCVRACARAYLVIDLIPLSNPSLPLFLPPSLPPPPPPHTHRNPQGLFLPLPSPVLSQFLHLV